MSDQAEALTVRPGNVLREFALLHDVPLQITIEVGRLQLRVRDLMKLAPGKVLELKKPAGEPFDICVNGLQIARGEVIVVEATSGVRIIDVQKLGSLG